jgi:hypothetical protein
MIGIAFTGSGKSLSFCFDIGHGSAGRRITRDYHFWGDSHLHLWYCKPTLCAVGVFVKKFAPHVDIPNYDLMYDSRTYSSSGCAETACRIGFVCGFSLVPEVRSSTFPYKTRTESTVLLQI